MEKEMLSAGFLYHRGGSYSAVSYTHLFMALSCMTDYSIVLHTIIFSLCLAAVYGLFRLIRQGTLIQRILYFRTYMQSSLVKKQWVPYREQSGMDDSCMHLAPAVLGGYLLTLGAVSYTHLVPGSSGTTGSL